MDYFGDTQPVDYAIAALQTQLEHYLAMNRFGRGRLLRGGFVETTSVDTEMVELMIESLAHATDDVSCLYEMLHIHPEIICQP